MKKPGASNVALGFFMLSELLSTICILFNYFGLCSSVFSLSARTCCLLVPEVASKFFNNSHLSFLRLVIKQPSKLQVS